MRGVVLDADTRQPVQDVTIELAGASLGALSNAQGEFRLDGVLPGEVRLVFRHLAYREHAESVTVDHGATLELEVTLAREAIDLAPLLVRTRSQQEERRRASGNAFDEIAFPEIQAASRRGMRLGELLRAQMPGVRLRPEGAGMCLEYRLMGAGAGCRSMAVVVDGQLMSAPGALLFTVALNDVQRLEVLSPGEAGSRYGGMAAHGVLLIETRTGPIPGSVEALLARSTVGWDDVEPEPYPWKRVAGITFATNALLTGLTYVPLAYCTEVWEGSLQRRPRCDDFLAMGVAIAALGIPGSVAGLTARRAGATAHSRGSLGGTTMGMLSHFSGHVLFFHGRASGSRVLETAGVGMLTVGTPLITMLFDRFIRRRR